MVFAFAPLVCGAVISACTSTVDYPPVYGPYASGSGNGSAKGGGGGDGSTSPCEAQGGQCTSPGNIVDGGGTACPIQLPASCGPGSVTEAGDAVLICCGGYNDAGPPDAIADAPKQ